MFFGLCKRILRTLMAFALAVGVLFFVWGAGVTRFQGITGTRTYYVYSASSQAEMKKVLSLRDLGNIRGESVSFSWKKGNSVEALVESYGGRILFKEKSSGVTSYYCYTPKWTDGVWVEGQFVNLHIAVKGKRCVMGAPLIFGGF